MTVDNTVFFLYFFPYKCGDAVLGGRDNMCSLTASNMMMSLNRRNFMVLCQFDCHSSLFKN